MFPLICKQFLLTINKSFIFIVITGTKKFVSLQIKFKWDFNKSLHIDESFNKVGCLH